ncbi:MAG: hypothetical protein WBC44_11075 [Planctomycetaceae bacterium]
MSTVLPTITLPLLTLGLPGRVSGWLLDAGMPIIPIETTAVRRGIAPKGEGRSIVLFDSRNASARTDAEAAEALGYETIDVARLLVARPADDDPERTVVPASDPRRRFFDGLRLAIEEAGGLWVRLADFPYPYRWAVCDESSGSLDSLDSHGEAAFASALTAFAELPAGNGSHGRLPAGDWLMTCASAGRPIRLDGDAAETLSRHGRRASGSPSTWTTTLADFAGWWRVRRRLALKVVRHGRACEIELGVPRGVSDDGFVVPVEIWRGRHVAVVPVRPGRLVLSDDSLPFQLNAARHPAGFTTEASDVESSGFSNRTAAIAAV